MLPGFLLEIIKNRKNKKESVEKSLYLEDTPPIKIIEKETNKNDEPERGYFEIQL